MADLTVSRLEEDLDLAVHLVDVVGEPVGDGQAGGGVGVVAAGVHQARTLGDEAFASGDVAVFGGFRDGDAVDVEADGERGAGTTRVHHADAAREAVHFGEELFAHAVLAGELEAGFNNLEVAAEAVVGIDDFLAEQHFVAEEAIFLVAAQSPPPHCGARPSSVGPLTPPRPSDAVAASFGPPSSVRPRLWRCQSSSFS